jgi:hypothetical protein
MAFIKKNGITMIVRIDVDLLLVLDTLAQANSRFNQ